MNATDLDAFIARWGSGISRGGNAYVFERSVTEHLADGRTTPRALDLYRRGCFVLEGKDTWKPAGSGSWDAAIVKAHKQAENYVKALSAEEGRPPFIIVVDVGRAFVLYSEFTRTGGNYVPFPDPCTGSV